MCFSLVPRPSHAPARAKVWASRDYTAHARVRKADPTRYRTPTPLSPCAWGAWKNGEDDYLELCCINDDSSIQHAPASNEIKSQSLCSPVDEFSPLFSLHSAC